MWELPFDPSMLGLKNGVVIHCPYEHLAEELFDILEENGMGENWGHMDDTKWSAHRENTAYFCRNKRILYGPMTDAECNPYNRYTKCTFYGSDGPDFGAVFEAATDDELCAFLGIGGV